MTDCQRPVVANIIEQFKSRLDDSVRKQISDAQFTDLALMIDAALSEEAGSAADLIEEVVRKLRAGSQDSELGL